MRAEKIPARPDGLVDDMPGGSSHWRLKLERPRYPMNDARRRHTWTVYWSQGPGCGQNAPDLVDVLESLGMDRVWEPFEEWVRGFGYDEDSRRAERIYRACVKATRQWERFWEGAEFEESAFE